MGKYTSAMLRLLLLMFLDTKEVLGIVDMTCSPTDTAFGEASTCTCTTDSGTGIAWQKDGTNVMLCYTGGACDITLADYDNGYSTSGTNKVFTITIKAFGYSDCSVFACKDQDTTDTDQQTLTLHEFNGGTPSINSEPGSNTNGSIEITTGCVFKGSDIKVNWYSVDSTNESKTYSTDTLFKTQTSCSDANKVCSGENAVTINTGFNHTEKTGECVKLRVEVFHSADPSNKLEWTTTGKYCIGGGTTTSSTTPPSTTTKAPDNTKTVIIIVGSVIGGVALVVGIIIACKKLRNN